MSAIDLAGKLTSDAEDAVALQTCALPIWWDDKGRLRVLMVTSRESKRWVMPKGWMMDGKKPWRAAEIEALEEAGAVGYISTEKFGDYHYRKKLGKGASVLCRVAVYPMIVEKLKRDWKERKERKRHWFSPRKAARLVQEPELAALLMELAEMPKKKPVLRKLLVAS